MIFQNRYKLTEKLAIKSLRNNCVEMLEFYRTKELRHLKFPKRLRGNSLSPKLVHKPSSWLDTEKEWKRAIKPRPKKPTKHCLFCSNHFCDWDSRNSVNMQSYIFTFQLVQNCHKCFFTLKYRKLFSAERERMNQKCMVSTTVWLAWL